MTESLDRPQAESQASAPETSAEAPAEAAPEASLEEAAPAEDFVAPEGVPLIAPSSVEHELFPEIEIALRTIYDPEIPVNIYDLGLVYSILVDAESVVRIDMTLTAPGCPVAGEMPGWVIDAVELVPGVREAHVNLVWDPPWTMDRLTDEARLELGYL